MNWISNVSATVSVTQWLFVANIALLCVCFLMFRSGGGNLQRPCVMLVLNLILLRIMQWFGFGDQDVVIVVEAIVFSFAAILCLVQKFLPNAIQWRT